MSSAPVNVTDRAILQGFVSDSLRELANRYPEAWRDYMEMYRQCLSPEEKLGTKIELGWFLYAMGFHQGRIDMVKWCREQNYALSELVARCDGEQGVRADGSNIDTLRAHVALGDLKT